MNKLCLVLTFAFFISFCSKRNERIINNQIPAERYIVYNNFPSKYVTPRHIEVWLPEGYDNIQALPVLYMFDGQNIFHGKKGWVKNTYNHGWQVDETLDSLFNIGNVPRMLVVGIFNTGIKRSSEYMPAKPVKDINKRIIQAEQSIQDDYGKYGITSDEFLKFIVKELKPFIDNNYKTIEGRSGTYLAGSSMGGLISAYAICEYPDVFGGAACFSTHWSILDGVFINYLKNNLPNSEFHKLYFDYGTLGLDGGYEPYQLIVDSLMVINGYKENNNWITKKFEDEDHNENFWRARFHYPIEFFFNNKN